MLINRTGKTWLAFVSLWGLALLSACSNDDDNIQNPTTLYSFDLTSSQVPSVPALASNGSGSATLFLNKTSGDLSGSITLNNITASAAHIHQGAAGTTGSIVITLTQDLANTQQFNIPANTVLSASQLDAWTNGEYYLNVHTQTNPTGELRGQILESEQTVLVTDLSTTQVATLSQISSSAAARGFMVVNQTSGDISGLVHLSNVQATAMHIHPGYLGTNGAPIVTLEQLSDPNIRHIPAGTVLTATQLTDLANGKLYLNLHTTANPSGELRGQIAPENVQLYVVDLGPAQNVTTTAQGKAFITLNTTSGLLNATVLTSGIAITNMHIHDGGGAVVTGLTATGDTSIWNVSDGTLSAAHILGLTGGSYYVNVHSSAYPSGELSGTIQ